MRQLRSRQGGMSLTGVLLGAALIGFFVYAGAKLVPIYIEHLGVTSSLKTLAGEEQVRGVGASEVRNQLMRRLSINNVQNVKPEHITVKMEGNRRVVSVDYEVRTPFYGNLYFLVAFSDSAVLSGN